MAFGIDRIVPDYSADWLEKLGPGLEATRLQRVRKQSLADLGLTESGVPQDPKKRPNSDALLFAGQRLFAGGDFEGGMKLLAEGRQLKQAETAEFSQKQWLEWLQKNKDKPPTLTGGIGPADERYISGPDPFYSTPPSAGSAPRVPSWLPPEGSYGVGGGGGPRTEAPAPAGAERLAGVPGSVFEGAPPPYQVAGPAVAGPAGPTPAGDGMFPPPPAPGTTPGGVVPGGGAIPGAGPRAAPPPAAPATGAEAIPGDPLLAAAVKKAGEAIHRMKFGSPPGPMGADSRKANYEEARYWLEQAKVPQEKRDWWISNLDRMREAAEEGDTETRPLTFSQWKHQEQIAKGQFESAEKLYQTGQDTRRKMETLKPALNRLQAIINHPAFTSGAGTQTLESGKAFIRNSKDFLAANGVPIPPDIMKKIDDATVSTQLREAFNSIVNSVIFDKLGSLGAQTSDRDLQFTTMTFPSLKHSKEGNRMIVEYYQDVIKKNQELYEKLQDVYSDFSKKGKPFNQNVIDRVTTAFWKDPKNDVLGSEKTGYTALGVRMQNEQAKNTRDYPEGAPVPAPGSGAYGVIKDTISPPRDIVEDENTGERFYFDGTTMTPIK